MKPLDILAGYHAYRARQAAKLCPTCLADMVGAQFRDELSRREHAISGLCQKCQDSYFAPQPEDKLP